MLDGYYAGPEQNYAPEQLFARAVPPVHMAPALPDVVPYITIPERPGIPHFDCDRLHARLSTSSCAQMWREANDEHLDHRTACRSCPLGARHAGITDASCSPIYGQLICARCTEGATRLIAGHLCASCYNREREFRVGKNGRGRKPIKVGKLLPRSLAYQIGQTQKVLRLDRTRSMAELIVAVLRSSVQAPIFGRLLLVGANQLDVRKLDVHRLDVPTLYIRKLDVRKPGSKTIFWHGGRTELPVIARAMRHEMTDND